MGISGSFLADKDCRSVKFVTNFFLQNFYGANTNSETSLGAARGTPSSQWAGSSNKILRHSVWHFIKTKHQWLVLMKIQRPKPYHWTRTVLLSWVSVILMQETSPSREFPRLAANRRPTFYRYLTRFCLHSLHRHSDIWRHSHRLFVNWIFLLYHPTPCPRVHSTDILRIECREFSFSSLRL
jgi:hypothetical protein